MCRNLKGDQFMLKTIAAAATVALLAIAPSTASAQSWYRVGGNAKQMSYVDLASLRPIQNKIIVTTQSIYAQPLSENIYATAIRSEYDCAGKYFRTLEYTYYDINAKRISTEPSQTINEHKTATAGSINEVMMEFICARKGGTLVTGDLFADARDQIAKM